jgi:hypothetical protein
MSRTLDPREFYGAEVLFLTSEQGGRKTPVFPHAAGFAGYRPNFRTSSNAGFHGCTFTAAPLQINPGDLTVIEMIFWCCEREHPDFKPGTEFELCEVPTRVAVGKFLLKGLKAYVNPDAK